MNRIRIRLSFPFLLSILLSVLVGFVCTSIGAAQTCEEWVAKVVSAQGVVEARRAGEAEWVPVALNETHCPGDMIRVGDRSRAAVVLSNETVLRLDANTTISISGVEEERTIFLDLLGGAAHFFSRTPRGLRITTPFVNGTVEGTEFFVRVEADQTLLTVFQGQVAAANDDATREVDGRPQGGDEERR